MASASGFMSLQAASDQLLDHVCGPCEDEGTVIVARQYCGVCSVFLCDSCERHHRKLPLSKSHKTVPAHTVSRSTSRRLSLYCGCKNDREPEYHCENHNAVICSPCKDIKHHRCKTAPIHRKCSGYKTSRIDAVLAKSKSLKDKYDRLKQKCSSNKDELGRAKDMCQTEIKAFRKELNDFLDRLTRKMLKELSDLEDESRKQIDEQIATLTHALQMLDADHKMLTEAKVDGRNKTMFAAEVQAAKTIRDCENRLADLEKDFTEQTLSFVKNKKLTDLQAGIESFGAISKEDKKCKEGEKIVLLGQHAQSRRKVDIKLDDDDEIPDITDCAVLPNGYVVIYDYLNARLKLFDELWVCKDNLIILNVNHVTAVDSNNLIVSIPRDGQLQYVQALPYLKPGRTIQEDSEILGVCVSGDEIYVTCGNPCEIRVLGLDGYQKRRVPLDRSTSPCDITLSPSGEKIFFTDSDTATLICMKIDGKIVYKYELQDDCCIGARGMFCDSEDNLLVCISSDVQIIRANGRCGGTMLTSSDGLAGPSCIAYRRSDNVLIVGCFDLDHLLVYKMKD